MGNNKYLIMVALICGLSWSASAQELMVSYLSETEPLPIVDSQGAPLRGAANARGTYTGTVTIKKEKSFNGFDCTGTPSFPVTLLVTQTRANVQVKFNNLTKLLRGSVVRQKFTADTTVRPGDNTKRTFTVKVRRINGTPVKVTAIELVKRGRNKACLFRHTGDFTRQ